MDTENESKYMKDAKENYKTLSIIEYNRNISEMVKEKNEYLRKIEKIQCQIREYQNKKHKFCHITGGHDWITEREGGPYGELFTYCEKCKMESF